jgi:peptide/nickel transport system permease protein
MIVLVGTTVATFVLTRVLPGDPVHLLVGPFADQQTIDLRTKELGFDRPIPVQFVRYVKALLNGDLGTSIASGEPIGQAVLARLPATLELIGYSFTIAFVIAVALGVLAAMRPRGIAARLADFATASGNAMPTFWLALLLMYVFFYKLNWFPAPLGRFPVGQAPLARTGFSVIDALLARDLSSLKYALWAMTLPACAIGFHIQPPLLRLVHSEMKRLLTSDAVRTARSIGLATFRVVCDDAARLLLMPTLNMSVLMIGNLLSSIVFVETIFAWPGIGDYAVQAIKTYDFPVIQGVVLGTVLIWVALYAITDMVEIVVDPRVRRPT